MGFLSNAMGFLTGTDEAGHYARQAEGATRQAREWAIGSLKGAKEEALELQRPFREIGLAALPKVQDMILGTGEVDIETSPLYKLQQEEGEEAINRAAAARGEFGATPTVERIGEFTRRLAANETDKMFGRLMNLVDIGRGATTASTSSVMQTGGNIANVYTGTGAQESNLLSQRGSMFTEFSPLNIASDIAGMAGSIFGIPSFGGGGGGSYSPLQTKTLNTGYGSRIGR